MHPAHTSERNAPMHHINSSLPAVGYVTFEPHPCTCAPQLSLAPHLAYTPSHRPSPAHLALVAVVTGYQKRSQSWHSTATQHTRAPHQRSTRRGVPFLSNDSTITHQVSTITQQRLNHYRMDDVEARRARVGDRAERSRRYDELIDVLVAPFRPASSD
jgi:hypothetical protein